MFESNADFSSTTNPLDLLDNRQSSHSIQNLQVHIVWCTKYRYQVLNGDVQIRCRDLIKQGCDSMDINILNVLIKTLTESDQVATDPLYVAYLVKLDFVEVEFLLLKEKVLRLFSKWFGTHPTPSAPLHEYGTCTHCFL